MKRSTSHIKTERLWLRQIDETDVESIVRLRSDENVYKYFLNPVKLTLKEHRQWYETEYIHNNDRMDWVAVDDSNGAFIGVYGAKKQGDKAEISYITANNIKHNGYASEAMNAIIQWCAEKWKTEVIVAKIHRDNKASIGFATHLGFQLVNEENGCFLKMCKRIL